MYDEELEEIRKILIILTCMLMITTLAIEVFAFDLVVNILLYVAIILLLLVIVVMDKFLKYEKQMLIHIMGIIIWFLNIMISIIGYLLS